MTCPEIPFIVPLKPCPSCGPGGDNCDPIQIPQCSWDPTTVVDPVPNDDPNYDPVGFKWVRYVGQMVNTQNDEYVNGSWNGDNLGTHLYPDGSIITPWVPVEPRGGLCVGSAYPRNPDGYHVYAGIDLQPNPYTDYKGTTSYTEPQFRPWRSSIRVSTSGLAYGPVNPIFIGSMCYYDPETGNAKYWVNPSSGGVFGAPLFRGMLRAEEAYQAGRTEVVTIDGYFEFSWETPDGLTDEPTRPTTTWTGINDDGSCSLPVYPDEDFPEPTPEPGTCCTQVSGYGTLAAWENGGWTIDEDFADRQIEKLLQVKEPFQIEDGPYKGQYSREVSWQFLGSLFISTDWFVTKTPTSYFCLIDIEGECFEYRP